MRARTRFQQAGELSVFLTACLAGAFAVPALLSVTSLSVLLLFVSDRGQHRALVERFQSRPRDWILLLSFGSHLGLNMLALAASYAVGWFFIRGLYQAHV